MTMHRGWTPEGHDTSAGAPPRASGPGTWPAFPPTPPVGAGGWPVQHGPDAPPPPAAPGSNGRRNRLLLVGAAVLAVAATVAGVLTHRALGSGPDTPQEAAEAFLSAGLRQDWRATWELLCRGEQLEYGSVDSYLMVREAAAAIVGSSNTEDVTVSVGEARPSAHSESGSWVVDAQLTRAGELHDLRLVVVAEDDGLRACGRV